MWRSGLDSHIGPAKRILVVAPHPDDETLGCGGLIAAAARRNSRVHVLFVTDGGASHPPSSAWPRERLAREREREAREALRLLGAGGEAPTFLRLSDADMPARGSAQWELAFRLVVGLIDNFRPTLAVLPWHRDPHRDHRDSFALVSEALEMANSESQRLEYAIWLDEFGAPEDFPLAGEYETVVLPIEGEQAIKATALQAHATQLGAIDAEAPGGFSLSPMTVNRLTGPVEIYFRSCA